MLDTLEIDIIDQLWEKFSIDELFQVTQLVNIPDFSKIGMFCDEWFVLRFANLTDQLLLFLSSLEKEFRVNFEQTFYVLVFARTDQHDLVNSVDVVFDLFLC